MRRFLSVVAGVFGLWIFSGGLMSVVLTEAGSFIPAMWTNLLLGAALLVGSVLLWRGRAPHGAGPQPHAAEERRRGARG
jgi:lipopolysaccharide export LptBFGC system permease protein LptF